MGLISNVKNSINARITAYGIAGSIPSVPEATLETLSPDGVFQDREAQERLCDVVQAEGDEAIRHLLINYTHRTKLAILEYARKHGMDAAKSYYRTPETAPETGRVALSIVRILLVWIVVTAIMALKWKVKPSNAALTGVSAAGAMAMVECWYYVGTDLMTKAWSWWQQTTKPAIWRDVDKLGEMYLHGLMSATELNQSIAMARSIEARCAWDRTTRVPVGTATGLLRAEGVCAGMQTGTPLDLSLTDMCTSLLVVGGTGSGKTQLINAMIVRIMSSDPTSSIVIIDPKRSSMLDVYNAYLAMLPEIQASYKFRVIGPEGWEAGYNPIDPAIMTPEAAAAILTDAIKAEGGSGGGDDYWNTMVAEIAYATMHIHDLAGLPRDFAALYATMTSPAEELLGIITAAEGRNAGNDHALETIKRAAEIIRVNLIEIPDKTKGNIISSISSWLGRFTMPSMRNFRASTVSLADLLNEKCLYVIDVPESLGKPGRLLRYYLFRQVYDVALSRLSDRTLNQDRHIIMFADEVQESTNQWSFRKSALSREGRLCIVAATQSRSQLLSVWGHKEATDTVVANFRSRIILGTDDLETREWAKKLISEGEMPEHSYGTSTTRSMGMSIGGGGGAAGGLMMGNPMALFGLGSMNMGKSWSKNHTVQLKRSPLRDELFDSLGARQAIVVLNQGNCRRKSLAELEGLFLKKDAELARKLRDHHISLTREDRNGTDTDSTDTALEQAAPGGSAGNTNENDGCTGAPGPVDRQADGPAGEAADNPARPRVEAGTGEGGEDRGDPEGGAAGCLEDGEDLSSLLDSSDDPTGGKGAAGTAEE